MRAQRHAWQVGGDWAVATRTVAQAEALVGGEYRLFTHADGRTALRNLEVRYGGNSLRSGLGSSMAPRTRVVLHVV